VIPVLTRRTLRTLLLALRVWTIVLAANLAATWAFAFMSTLPGLFAPVMLQAMGELSAHTMDQPFWHTALTGGAAGWLIGLMVWLLPSADANRALIIILLTYVIAICQFPHVVAGSVEAAFGVFIGHATLGDYAFCFLLPTLLGNAAGGTILAALLNHAPLSGDLRDDGEDSGA
jgi:formate/nitrite transporter FocA (FNT family)